MDPRRSPALRFLDYHAWATQQTLDSAVPLSSEELHRDMQTSHSSVWGTLEHIFRADRVWLRRWEGENEAKLDDAPLLQDLAALREQWSRTQARLISWAGGLNDADWTRVLEYRLGSGQSARSPVYDNILHVVNHGTYHRGQIVTMLRQLGAKPIPTDYVAWVRQMQF